MSWLYLQFCQKIFIFVLGHKPERQIGFTAAVWFFLADVSSAVNMKFRDFDELENLMLHHR